MRINKTPLRIGILADDLTGAGDVGGCFARAGLKTVVVLPFRGEEAQSFIEPEFLREAPGLSPEVFVIDTESRTLDPSVARTRVLKAFDVVSAWGANFFYKKIDSALRGLVGYEMDAFLEALIASRSHQVSEGCRVHQSISPVPVVAAYPEAGRETRQGWQFVDGVRLDRSPFLQDPRGGVRQAHVPTLLRETCRSWPFFKVEDCARPADMRKLAKGAMGSFSRSGFFACVGSAGLANDLARLLSAGGSIRGASFSLKQALSPRLPTIIVCGSRHPSSLLQLDRFLGSDGRGSVVFEGPTSSPPDIGEFVRSISGRRRPTVVVRSSSLVKEPQAVTGWLARTTRRLLRAVGPGQLVLMGGDTAFRVCEGLGVRKLSIRGMGGPGIAFCEAVGPQSVQTPKIVLKPGGFGPPSTLIDLLKN